MKEFDAIIIGFGKGGKTLAAALGNKGYEVALIERSERMYGGTCINVGCIPSKSLVHSAELSAKLGGDFAAKAARYQAAVTEKNRVTGLLRQKNYDKLNNHPHVTVLHGEASFTGEKRVAVRLAAGGELALHAPQIFINTGARPFLPPIPGLADHPRVYVSETLMDLQQLPARLAIIGGGYIGMEFASLYQNFGSQVTVIQDGPAFLPREDEEIAQAVLASLRARGIEVLLSAKVEAVGGAEDCAQLRVTTPDGPRTLPAEAVLVATGRRPNVEGLNLAAAGVAVTSRGAVQVDNQLRTAAPGVWALGDVAGGLQFTYISLDDERIVLSQLAGDGARSTDNRGAVPYSVFLDPPFSRVGLSEAEARAQGRTVKVARLPAAAIPKAQVLGKTDGILKAVVDGDSGQILGAHLFCAQSQEMINLVKLAMDAGLPYTALRDAIYTHPTMTEAFNDLFAAV